MAKSKSNEDRRIAKEEKKSGKKKNLSATVLPFSKRPDPPPSASNRRYLRAGLPGLYQDDFFAMRFVGALEQSLDPIVAMLDQLPQHFDPNYAPNNILELIADWLGVDLDESHDQATQRSTVMHATELSRKRGTRAGIELALQLAFPELDCRVEDSGSIKWSTKDEVLEHPPAGTFKVHCISSLTDLDRMRVSRFTQELTPVGASFEIVADARRAQ